MKSNMKYIKPYKIFEADDAPQTIRDICLDLEDDGYKIHLRKKNGSDFNFQLSIKRADNSTFRISRIESTLSRIENYLGKNLIRVEVTSLYNMTRYIEIQFYSWEEGLLPSEFLNESHQESI